MLALFLDISADGLIESYGLIGGGGRYGGKVWCDT